LLPFFDGISLKTVSFLSCFYEEHLNYLMAAQAGRHVVDHCNPDYICLINCNFKYLFLCLFKALVGILVIAVSFVSFEGTLKQWLLCLEKKVDNLTSEKP